MTHRKQMITRGTSRGCTTPLMVAVVAIVGIMMFFGSVSFLPEINRQRIEQEKIKTQQAQQSAKEAAARAELWTAFYSDTLAGLRDVGTVGYFALLGGVVVAFLFAGIRQQKERVDIENERRFWHAENNRLIDSLTGETMDLNTGQIFANETTAAKLSIYGQTERIKALGGIDQRFNSAMGKTALQSWQPREQQHPAHQPPPQLGYDVESVVIPTVHDAIRQSAPDAWIIGHDDDGSLAMHYPNTDPHIAICGSTGSRKTSNAAMLFVAYARKFGYHVVILDGKNGVDWGLSPLAGMYEHHTVNAANIESYIDQITAVYHHRSDVIKSADISHIAELDAAAYPPIFVVIEELSQPFYELDKESAERVKGKIGRLMSVCRFTGISIMLIDQRPKRAWNEEMKGNVGALVCYKLKMHQGKAVSVEKAEKLAPGQFNHDGEVYEGWFTAKEYPLNKNLPLQTTDPVLSVVAPAPVSINQRFTDCATTSQPVAQPATTSHNHPATTPQPPQIDWERYGKMKGEKLKAALIEELPKLQGEPVDDWEIDHALECYINLPSKNMAYFAIWGIKDGRRADWLQDVIDDHSNE